MRIRGLDRLSKSELISYAEKCRAEVHDLEYKWSDAETARSALKKELLERQFALECAEQNARNSKTELEEVDLRLFDVRVEQDVLQASLNSAHRTLYLTRVGGCFMIGLWLSSLLWVVFR
jgi:hypothetical protein